MNKGERNNLRWAEDFLKRAAAGVSAQDEIQVGKIADEVGISVERLPKLLAGLEAADALRRDGQRWSLTAKGWAQGRQTLRAHRIYEGYLAEQTGLHPAECHAEADRREHELDPQTVNRMAAELNRPRFDPHGDAIPTRGLEMEEAIRRRQVLTLDKITGFRVRLTDAQASANRVCRSVLSPH